MAATDYWYFDELQRQARAKTDSGRAYNPLEAEFVRRVGEGWLQRPVQRGRYRNPPQDIRILVAFDIARSECRNNRDAAAAVGESFHIGEDGVLSAVKRARDLNVEWGQFNI